MYDHGAMQSTADDLQAQVLSILRRHVGAQRAIKAGQIAALLDRRGRYADRPIREAIKALRRAGHLIISSVHEPYGYFLAATEAEWREFRDRNLQPRAFDILQTVRMMGEAAQRQFGATAALDLKSVRQLELLAVTSE